MRITLSKVVAVVIILAMVAGIRQLDREGWFNNPIDKAPSVQFNQ